MDAYINRIATAVPPHDVHDLFIRFAGRLVQNDSRRANLFHRMVERCGIGHRFSCLQPGASPDRVDVDGFYRPGCFPGTAERMQRFETAAPALAQKAVETLLRDENRDRITHLIITSCTGFSAPGLDLELIARCGLPTTVERTHVGFMGCYAAINALKLARHIVRSDPAARILAVNLELCTLHLQETPDLDTILSFLLFGDGCAAALISADPVGAAMESFHAMLAPDTSDLIQWRIRQQGFDMVLSGGVPRAIEATLKRQRDVLLRGTRQEDISLWAVHPGGRSVLDAVERSLALPAAALAASRQVLNDFGNMSSGTVMFVLDRLMRQAAPGALGCAMSFGPGLVAETMRFRMAG
ncbi:MAG TPA: type III polyketide synthase [Rhizomicrobium sp.]|nr:type III polyketide synthase [Rhizomicrobium sp.]